MQLHALNLSCLPFEDEGNDKVRVDSDSPVTLFPSRVGLRVVGRQNHSRRAADVSTTGRWRKINKEKGRERKRKMIRQHRAWGYLDKESLIDRSYNSHKYAERR